MYDIYVYLHFIIYIYNQTIIDICTHNILYIYVCVGTHEISDDTYGSLAFGIEDATDLKTQETLTLSPFPPSRRSLLAANP